MSDPIRSQFAEYAAYLASGPDFDLPTLNHCLDARWPAELGQAPRFARADARDGDPGLHYELRIAERGEILLRPGSWHDAFAALVWLQWPALKWALHREHMHDLALVGAKQRTRHQQAITHLDEGGAILIYRDERVIEALDQHDWPRLYATDLRASFRVQVIGHALHELRWLKPSQLLAAKVLPVQADEALWALDGLAQRQVLDPILARAIATRRLGDDPKDMPTLPLAGLPEWRPRHDLADADAPSTGKLAPEELARRQRDLALALAGDEARFLREASCFRPRPAGRCYAPPLRLAECVALAS